MKLFEIFANLLFWLFTAWLLTNSFSIESKEIDIDNGVEIVNIVRSERLFAQICTLVAISFLAFYANLYNIIQLISSQKRSKVFLSSLLILLVSIMTFIMIQRLIFGLEYPNLAISFAIGVSIFYFTVSSAYGVLKVWVLSEQRHQQLLLANKHAELSLLRNQLRPHFLFNALNNLLSMVDQQNSPQLTNSFEKLSNLLRYVIEETKSEKVSVSAEIEFLKNYCELQLLRFEKNEVDLQFKVYGRYRDLLVEPGLFIPFVENAFKYGTEPESKAIINIEFDLNSANEIGFLIKNKKAAVFEKVESTRIGIQSTKERLNLVYPNNHILKISDEDYFLVELNIKTA